jgi:hypothetical protein
MKPTLQLHAESRNSFISRPSALYSSARPISNTNNCDTCGTAENALTHASPSKEKVWYLFDPGTEGLFQGKHLLVHVDHRYCEGCTKKLIGGHTTREPTTTSAYPLRSRAASGCPSRPPSAASVR